MGCGFWVRDIPLRPLSSTGGRASGKPSSVLPLLLYSSPSPCILPSIYHNILHFLLLNPLSFSLCLHPSVSLSFIRHSLPLRFLALLTLYSSVSPSTLPSCLPPQLSRFGVKTVSQGHISLPLRVGQGRSEGKDGAENVRNGEKVKLLPRNGVGSNLLLVR